MAEVIMRWQKQRFCFRSVNFEVEHFDVGEKSSSSSEEDDETRHQRSELRAQHAALERCEAELGACLWIDTNRAALLALEAFRPSYLGCRALELGAGAGACGIALAYDGADVTISDVDALLPLMQRNVQLNRLPAVRKTAEVEAGGYATGAVAGVEGAAAAAEPNLEEVSAKTKSRLRKAKAAEKAQRRGKAAAELPLVGTCQALAVEWSREALQPSLPENNFELIVVCDCLYENRDSWEALRSLLHRLPVPSAAVLLASAMLRKPFLQAFVALLQEDGFTLTSEEQGGRLGDVCIAFLRPPAASQEEAFHEKETMAAVVEKGCEGDGRHIDTARCAKKALAY